MVLTLLAILVAALVALAAVAGLMPRIAATAGAGASALRLSCGGGGLASGAGGATLALPIGPAGASMHLAWTAAASFLLLLFLVMPCAGTAPLALAASGGHSARGRRLHAGVGLLLLGGAAAAHTAAAAAACVAFALAALETSPRCAPPPEGWSAAAVLLLVLTGAGTLSRVSPAIAGYLVLRVLFDLCGAEQPLWWGVPLLLAGAASPRSDRCGRRLRTRCTSDCRSVRCCRWVWR